MMDGEGRFARGEIQIPLADERVVESETANRREVAAKAFAPAVERRGIVRRDVVHPLDPEARLGSEDTDDLLQRSEQRTGEDVQPEPVHVPPIRAEVGMRVDRRLEEHAT